MFRLREQTDVFIRHVQRIIAAARLPPDPQSLLDADAGPKKYICVERHQVASRVSENANALIEHARNIQEHCNDLERTPPSGPTSSTPQTSDRSKHDKAPDIVALKLEQKARTTELAARLRVLSDRSDIVRRTIYIVEKHGLARANAYMRGTESKVLQPSSLPTRLHPNPKPAND